MKPILLTKLCCRKNVLFVLLLFLLPCITFSQTTFYLNTGTPSSVTPTISTNWNVSTGYSSFLMSPAKDASTTTNVATASPGGAFPKKVLLDQWVSDPLAAQTIAAGTTLTGQSMFKVSNTTGGTTGMGSIYLRIINTNGSLASEVLVNTTTFNSTTSTNRSFSYTVPAGGIVITAGQMICIELGWTFTAGTNTTRTASITEGSSIGTDLPVNNTSTTLADPWFKFAQTLVFLAPTNDACANATLLTPAAICSPTTGNLQSATSAAPAGGCGGATTTTTFDVWYKFVATATTHTVTVGNLGAGLTAATTYIETFNGSCAGASMGCQTAATRQTLTTVIGTTYYVRVYVTVAPTSFPTAKWNFDICIEQPPANDDCAGAITLTPGASCVNTAGTLDLATANAATPIGCFAAGTYYDVWYKFVATSSTHTVLISSPGANFTAPRIQLYTGSCGALVSVAGSCVSANTLLQTGLTIGTTYYVRIANFNTNPSGTGTVADFNICVTAQAPANDDCTTATVLTAGTTCVTTTSNIQYANTNSMAGACGGATTATTYDVWFKFQATATTQFITLSSLGTNLAAATTYIETLSGTCGSLTSLGCQSAATMQTVTGLTVGTFYYVRVYVTAAPTNVTTANWNFNICIVQPPVNDACTGAIALTSASTCTNTVGTLLYATATSGLPTCGNSGSADVWYSFVALSNHPIITLSSVGANLTTASPLIQLYSGACGNLVQLTGACTASPLNTATTPGGIGLSINSTYYIRVTTNTNTGVLTSGTYGFSICVTDPAGASVDYAKSYINVTDGTIGGTIDPGDVLEIRAILVVQRPGNTGPVIAIDSVAYYDTLTAGKGFALLKDSMALKTNEGKLFRPSNSTYFTDAKDADAAWITTAGAGTDTALQINMGTGATQLKRGKITHTSKPSNFGNTCIIMATYRVRVNAAYGTKIMYGGGAFRYRDSTTATFYTISFPRDSLIVFASPGACPDAVSATNIVGDEVNGTFGAPTGAPVYLQNRGSSTNTNYAYAPFNGTGGGPGDYYYSVANNTSGDATTVQTVAKPPAVSSNRVFGVWDITGDHTGAANTAKGNLPCNLNAPISATNPCGYMLVVNAAYRTDVAFAFNFSGACTETYYEVSAWIKNICSKCGCDSNGVGSTNTGYQPTAVGDSSGIRPNLAFQINGVDYYTTGDLAYQGLGGTQTGSDTLNKWVKRSFVYKTKPGETSFTMTLRNNAPGGGGNDWAVDDISIRTCYPNMSYSPSSLPSVCAGHTLTLTDTVRSYYNVYIYYKWQRSTDGGTTWNDIAGTSGVASPTLVGPNNYQFTNSYTLPPSATAVSNNGDLYRMVVATNALNLSGSCNYSDITPVALTVLNNCIDIDDDNDGIPDYVEFNNPIALQDANSNGIPNWNDPTYPGYVDNNLDGVNDNFDYGADSNNDGIPNYMDPTFPGFIDTNGDGINDNSDKDLDGIPNQYDLDSDNDGIPDVVESYGVDTNGDGIIDNYTDTDNDGFSQNVDGNATGVTGSGVGLGAQDFDGDGIPNYLDTDSDNDGIPDVVEVGGPDTNNDGKLDGFVDANADGLNDNYVGITALLKTGVDLSPVNGRADNYPYKNLDQDAKPNPYDLDSDGDGIADVIEAGLPDANTNGIVDGTIGTNGWSTTVSAMASLNLRNTDGSGNPDYLDIDSDDDGIPDNIEGQSTAGYKLPVLTDTDGDGIVDTYDNTPLAYGGSGIFVWDQDGDGIPDYRDLDTDGDGKADIIEGNDFNLNGFADDPVTLTGTDTDGDGLDNRFDSLNSTTNVKGTSYMMGNGGSTTGDAAPGTKAPVQKKTVGQIDRDWRYVGVVLPVQFLEFTGNTQGQQELLNWKVLATIPVDHFEVERSLDNATYNKVGVITDPVKLNEEQSFGFTDNIKGITSDVIYYRLKVVGKLGEIKYSNVLVVRQALSTIPITMMPNPANGYVTINLYADKNTPIAISLLDKTGKKVLDQAENLSPGFNNINLNLEKYSQGVYAVIIQSPTERIVKQLMIIR